MINTYIVYVDYWYFCIYAENKFISECIYMYMRIIP